MAKTLSNLQAQTRTYLDEATQSDWTDTEVTREINSKYMELYVGVVEVYEDYYSTRTTVASVADQQEYTLPSDLYKIRRIEINYNPSNSNSLPRKAVNVPMDSVLRDLGNSALGITVYRNPAYYVRGTSFGFIPIPTEAGASAITVWYIAIPSELSASSDAINIPFPDRYGQLISLGAASVLLRKGQQEEVVAKEYLRNFEMGIIKMKQELEDRIAEGVKSVVDTAGMDNDFESGFSNL